MESQQRMNVVNYAGSGIYQIHCLPEDRYYIGSSQKVRSRILYHLSYLRRGKHKNFKLLEAWVRWGPDAFVFSLIEKCAQPHLAIREAYWIKVRKGLTDGFNLATQPYGFPKMSPEALAVSSTRAKRWWTRKRRAAFGVSVRKRHAAGLMPKRVYTKEQRENLSKKLRGRSMSIESRRKLSIAKTGKVLGPRSQATCRNIARALRNFYRTHPGNMKGKKLTAVQRTKISASNSRRTLSSKTRKKISNRIRAITYLWKRDPVSGTFLKQGPLTQER